MADGVTIEAVGADLVNHPAEQSAVDRLVVWLVRHQNGQFGKVVNALLRLRGTDISPQATLGADLRLPHTAIAVVVHPRARIGNHVTIYQGVTVGRADVWRGGADFVGIDIEDDVVLCAGAVVAAPPGGLRIGRGTIVGANAVLTTSTGEFEVWAGSPARKLRDR